MYAYPTLGRATSTTSANSQALPRMSAPNKNQEYLSQLLPFQHQEQPNDFPQQGWNSEGLGMYRNVPIYPQGQQYPYMPQQPQGYALQQPYATGEELSPKSAKAYFNDPAHQQTGVYYAAPAAHDSQIWKRTSNGYVVPLHPQAKVGKDTGKSRKRFRRKFSEIDRIFRCTHTGCDKAYGKLNHLNTHIISQKHGEKKTTEEYRELLRSARGSHNARDDDHDSEGSGSGRRTSDQTELKYNSVRPYDPTVNYTTGPQGYPPVAGAGFDPAGYNGYYPNGAPYGAFPQGFAPAPQPPANPLQHAQFLPYGAAGYPQPYRGEEKVSILNDDKDAGTVQ